MTVLTVVLSCILVLSLLKNSQLKNDLFSTEKITQTDSPSVTSEANSSNEPETENKSSDFNTYKKVFSQDEIEQILFGQVVSTDRNGEYRIGVKCADNGDFHAQLTVYLANNGKYETVFSCPAVIGKNGAGKQAEGDGKTPLGTWQIGQAYGIKENPGTDLTYTKITEDMYWCATGSNSDKYNKLILDSEEPDTDRGEDEHLIDYETYYSYLVDLGYNSVGAPYAGNAIFLHCWKDGDSPTGGCVAVSEENMIKILRIISPDTTVTVY